MLVHILLISGIRGISRSGQIGYLVTTHADCPGHDSTGTCKSPHLLRRNGVGVVLVPGVGGQGLLHRLRAARRVIVHLWELPGGHLAIGPQRGHAARLALLGGLDISGQVDARQRLLQLLVGYPDARRILQRDLHLSGDADGHGEAVYVQALGDGRHRLGPVAQGGVVEQGGRVVAHLGHDAELGEREALLQPATHVVAVLHQHGDLPAGHRGRGAGGLGHRIEQGGEGLGGPGALHRALAHPHLGERQPLPRRRPGQQALAGGGNDKSVHAIPPPWAAA